MASGLIGKAAKLVKGKSRSYTKKKPNKKTRTARNKRKNLVEDMKAEDRHMAGEMGGKPNYPKPSTQSQKKRSKAKAKATFYQKQRKADRKDDEAYFKKYGKKNDIPF